MPAYNAERTILKAAYSCLNQTIENTELIIIDDCSTDSTRTLIEQLKTEFPDKLKLIYQEKNQRQGAARNIGVKEAAGEYILFVDSDDWIEPDTCEKFLAVLKDDDDIDEVVGDYNLVYENGEQEQINVFDSAREYLGYQNDKIHTALLMQPGYFWCKLYKKDFLKTVFPDGILFPEGVRSGMKIRHLTLWLLYRQDGLKNWITVSIIIIKIRFRLYRMSWRRLKKSMSQNI